MHPSLGLRCEACKKHTLKNIEKLFLNRATYDVHQILSHAHPGGVTRSTHVGGDTKVWWLFIKR